MAKRPTFLLLITALSLCLVTALAFVGHGVWRNWYWQQELYGLVGYYGTDRAIDDFKSGKRRLFELGEARQDEVFTGKMDGPFEIWNPQFLPSLGYPHRYATEEFVAFYNRKMRYMHAHPEEFLVADARPGGTVKDPSECVPRAKVRR